jgi:tetratricopeptide (TPR) repeat protein
VILDKRRATQRATALVQEGQLQRAIAEYEAILRADPSDPSLYNTLGDLHARIGSIPDAVACYQKLIEVLRADGLRSRAIALYKKIAKLEPSNFDALLACADLYVEEGLQAEAKYQYLSAAERALKLGFDKMALELYERLSRMDPDDPSIAGRLAALLARDGRRSAAAELLGRLAMEARTKGRHGDARLLYQQMVQICPEMSAGWYGLGRLEFEDGRLREAEGHLRRASEIDPSSPLPHLLLGHLYRQEGRRESAKAAWQALLERDPEHMEVRHLLGQLHLLEGETEAAVREYDAVAGSLGDSGELDEAIALLAELGPAADHPLILERLGDLLARSERLPEARDAYSRAAELYRLAGRDDEHRRLVGRMPMLGQAESHDVAETAQVQTDEEVSVVVLNEPTAAAGLSILPVGPDASEADRSLEGAGGPENEARWILEVEDQGDLRLHRAAAEGEAPGPAASGGDGATGECTQAGPQGVESPDGAGAAPAASDEIGEHGTAEQARGDRGSGRLKLAGDAHYNLGVAYSEMGLLDDAVAEFRRSAADERYGLVARHMVGRCLLAKGQPEAAIHEFIQGLSMPGRPAEEYLEIKYDLAIAYQSAGDLAAATAILSELEGERPSFRDVRARLKALRAQPKEDAVGQRARRRDGHGTGGKEPI